MASPSLDNVKLKIVGAKERLDYFYRETTLFLTSSPQPFAVIRQHDIKPPHKYRFRLIIKTNPPPTWANIVGEIAHHLRSALDNLAWQLALLTTQSPYRSTEFPIFNSPAEFNDLKNRVERKLRDIPTNARTIIESLQPYHSGDWPEVETLWWLHEINRVDKHREIVPCYSHFIFKFSNRDVIYRLCKRLSDDEIINIEAPDKAGNPEVGVEIAFKIPTFDYPFPANRLERICKFISDEVIPRFEVFF